MKLATIKLRGTEQAAVVGGHGPVPIETINRKEHANFSSDLFELLQKNQLAELKEWYDSGGKSRLSEMAAVTENEVEYAPPYRNPRKICGIGMNYAAKAEQLGAVPPEKEPVCFLKPATCLIGPGENIVIPPQSRRVTAEAELCIVIGAACKNVSKSDAPSVVAGFTPALDMTAQDIHAKNPRFLGKSKWFDTFFSFGPHLVTADEIDDLESIVAETVLNGRVAHRDRVANMIFHPWYIVSHLSHILTLLPGDIIVAGTPGSVVIRDGDVAECRLSGFAPLVNPVSTQVDRKRSGGRYARFVI